MKKIYIDMTKEDWLDEYDFYRDVIGIIEEIYYDDELLEIFVDYEIYKEVMGEEEEEEA